MQPGPQVEAGRVKVLVITNRKRADAFPELPTATEAGYPSLTLDGRDADTGG